MKYFNLNNDNNFDNAISYAASVIKNGGLVAFPTETVYGLGADALNENAVKKIFQVKGRQTDNPLIIHIADKKDIFSIAKNIKSWVLELIDIYWPGPLSVVLEKSDMVLDTVSAGLDSVAIRMPDNIAALALIKQSGGYIAAPSANTSGKPSPTKAEHVKSDLYNKVDVILKHDNTLIGIESTVIDARGDHPIILRPGAITAEMLADVTGNTKIEYKNKTSGDAISPGVKYAHYQPCAKVLIVDGTVEQMAQKINLLIKNNNNIGLFSTKELADKIPSVKKVIYNDLSEAASLFFDMLRKFDEQNIDIIVCENFEDKGIGIALNNRLKKAADNKYL